MHPRLWEVYPAALRERYAPVKERLMNVGPARIAEMDAAGIDLQVLSHVQPGVQICTDPALAAAISGEVNDWLGGVVATYPTRFAGFATVPTQSPDLAADELERTVTQHGFTGALINGHTGGHYLDEPRFEPLLQRAALLGVPIYLHPTDPPEDVSRCSYDPYTAVLGPSWAWPVETGTHVLRMICGGVFDRHPDLKIIVGHLGELLPYCYARLSIGLTVGGWLVDAGRATGGQSGVTMQRPFAHYMKHNVYLTSSGVFEQPVFDCAAAMLGVDNLMFSVDSPLRDNIEAMDFLAACQLTPGREGAVRSRAGRGAARAAVRRDGTNEDGGRWKSWSARMRSRIGRALVAHLIS